MRPKTRRKQPITVIPTSSTPSTRGASHKATQSIIQSFHVLLKKKSLLEKSISSNSKDDEERISSQLGTINAEIEALGGLDAYQEASSLGQDKERGGDSSKVLIEWLRELGQGRRMEDKVVDGEKKMESRTLR